MADVNPADDNTNGTQQTYEMNDVVASIEAEDAEMADTGAETQERTQGSEAPVEDDLNAADEDLEDQEQVVMDAMQDVQDLFMDSDQEDSLFIPETTLPSTAIIPIRSAASTPSRPVAGTPSRSTKPTSISTFAKIRAMQENLKNNKAAKVNPALSYDLPPDSEAYLEAAQQSNAAEMEDYEQRDRELATEFKTQQKKFGALRAAQGHLTFMQDCEWMRIKSQESARKEKNKRDSERANEDDDGSSLFPDLLGPSSSLPNENRSDEDVAGLQPDGLRRRQRPSVPHKEQNLLSIQEAELQAMSVALDASQDLPKKKRKAPEDSSAGVQNSAKSRGSTKNSKPKGTTASSSRGAGAKRVRTTAKSKRQMADSMKQTTSLFRGNVFKYQPAEDSRPEPTFRNNRNKADALKEIIAAVPLESFAQAKNDTSALLNASRDFYGRGAVKPDGHGMWLVRGMKTSLKGYQIMGSAFMRRRETATEEPRGGLMADQMGLGKTLMMLANIVNGHPGKHSLTKTTLLVAAPALLSQWGREIELHTNSGLVVMRYSSGSRIDSNRAEEVLQHHDIILTTYSEVMRSYPKNEPPIECQSAEDKIKWWKETYETQRGALHRMMFHRIVLDEAQAIKSHVSRTSIACRALMAHHKWALSGTPITNTLTELYPYFKFLGVPHTGSFKIFKHNYCDTSNAENSERLLVRLSQFMIRRTHEDEMFGAPILKLPQATQCVCWIEFNSVERSIYEIVRHRFALHINMMIKKGNVEKSYNNALVMLLRLRQLTSSLLMLQFVLQDLAEREDLEKIQEVVKEAANDKRLSSGHEIILLRKQLDKMKSEEAKRTTNKDTRTFSPADEDEDDAEPAVETVISGSGKAFGKDFNFKPHLNSLMTGEIWEKKKILSKCGACNRHPEHTGEPAWRTSCGHILCDDCYDEAIVKSGEQGLEHGTCKPCGSRITIARQIKEDEGEALYGRPETRSMGRERHDKHRNRLEHQEINDEWLNMGGEGVLPSAKTVAVKAQILNFIQQDPNVKIIIYTQFLAMIKILAKVCQQEGWLSEQYHGKLSLTARDKAIQHFADDSEVKVLLASLRCGGLGLNLTMASRVIVLDPWWNEAAEQQAFCRVYRFGQKSTTHLTRLCVKNTVDERLIEMQEKKQKEIDEVMNDKGKTVGSMGLRDLMRLFGNLQEEESGKPFLLVDNPDPRGGFAAHVDDEGYADEI